MLNYVEFLGAGGGIMALIIKRIMTGFFDGHWSLLTTINGGLTGMVSDWTWWFVARKEIYRNTHACLSVISHIDHSSLY